MTQESPIPSTPDEGTYVQRTHKDKLFRFIFRDKKKLLQLYNAINQTSYEDVSQLTITTLDNVIYLGYKNDVSFLLDWALCLVEHQSTWNPNIPLRGFLYFARQYRTYLEQTDANVYGTKQILLPFPQFIVFNNGINERPEREILYLQNGYTPQTSVDLAVDRCLKEDVLTDVLKEHRQEVVTMFLDEYDDEIFTKRMYKAIAEEAREEGHMETLEQLNRLNQFLLRDGRQEDLLKSVSDVDFQKELLKEYGLFDQNSR